MVILVIYNGTHSATLGRPQGRRLNDNADNEMIHKHFADNTSAQSVASRMRRERFQILLDMIDGQANVSILDIGGRPQYWEQMTAGTDLADKLRVTMLNLEAHAASRPNFTTMVGDARSMPQFNDGQFDIVFSNSTIEHVGGFTDQQRMANEVRRVGRRYYIQTPNKYFPIEPHFVFPMFQFLPVAVRVWLLQRFTLGWMSRQPDRQKALNEVQGIRLLGRTEFQRLFPEATIYDEKFYGLVKSFVAYTK